MQINGVIFPLGPLAEQGINSGRVDPDQKFAQKYTYRFVGAMVRPTAMRAKPQQKVPMLPIPGLVDQAHRNHRLPD